MCKLFLTYGTDWDELVGVIHHGNEQIEQDDYIDHREGPKHEETKKPCKFLDASQLKVFQVYQAKYCPEQGLRGFPKTVKKYVS